MKAGVDVGGTKIQTVVLRDEQVVGSARTETPRTGDAADVIEAIVSTIREAQDGTGDVDGIGIGSPGDIDAETGTVSLAANVPGFEGRVELGPRVSAQLGGVPVAVGNDVSVAVLGTWQRGDARPY